MIRWILILIMLLGRCEATAAQPDRPWGWLIIPSVSLYQPITPVPLVEGQYDMTAIGQSVGWLERTATLETTRRDMQAQNGVQLDLYGQPIRPYSEAELDQETGRIVLAGHVDGSFAALDNVRVGDEIVLLDWQRGETYQVTAIALTRPGDVSWLFATAQETLVLITCAGVAPAYEWRRIVVAERVAR
jgi:LPXTG-site transpeptidase (sortase) family protein